MDIVPFFGALWQLSIAMAPYILFGLLFAGILHELVPDSIVTKHLREHLLSSQINGIWYSPSCLLLWCYTSSYFY